MVHHYYNTLYSEREPEPASDKAWVFERSRTYRPPPSDVAAQTDVSAMQEGDGSTVATSGKIDVATDPMDVDSTSIATQSMMGDINGADCGVNDIIVGAAETQDVSDDVTEVTFERRRP